MSGSIDRGSGWLSDTAREDMIKAAAAAHPNETGGILVGVVVGSDLTLTRPWVLHAVEVPSRKSGPRHYQLPRGARQRVVLRLRKTDGRLGYLGDWHSHPGDIDPSPTDSESIASAGASGDCDRPLLFIARRVGDGYEIDARQWTGAALDRIEVCGSGPLLGADDEVHQDVVNHEPVVHRRLSTPTRSRASKYASLENVSNSLPSASGARLSGDDYQHILTWIHALKLLYTDGDVTKIEFEADDAGNVDDLIVHRTGHPPMYHQIKFVVQQKEPLTHGWFTTIPKAKKKSPLQRFYDSYTKLSPEGGPPPELALHTNRLPAPGDPMLSLVSGTDWKLVPRLSLEAPRSAAGRVRSGWAEHLEVGDEELLAFLGHLAIRSGRDALNDLQDQCALAMRAVGFRSEPDALLAAVGALRALIRTGVRELDAETLSELANTLHLPAGEPHATLLVQSLVPDPWPETATAFVDWVDLFDGADAYSRRQLKDPSGWNGHLKLELATAVEQIKRARVTHVNVRGTMRLATGFFVGVQLSEVAGFKVAAMGREGEWTSISPRERATVERDCIDIGDGDDLAVVIAVSQPIRDDVVSFVRTQGLSVGKLIVYGPPGGASRDAVRTPESGVSLAAAISRTLREDTSSHRGVVHLFQSSPLPLAIMVGHLWNRMPATTLYEDLGPGKGYAPTFSI